MIAKSDLVILVVSASALLAGVARWQMNIAPEPLARVEVASDVASLPAADTIADTARPAEQPVVNAVPAGSGIASGASTSTLPAADRATVEPVAPVAPVATTRPAGQDSPVSPAGPLASGEPLYGVHEVVSGDNLGEIAQRFGTSVTSLREINGLDSTTILIGQRLRYPQAAN